MSRFRIGHKSCLVIRSSPFLRLAACRQIQVSTTCWTISPLRGKPPTPDGYDKWWEALVVVAENGSAELETTFRASLPDFKSFTLNKNKEAWAELKRIASKKGGAK
jgi:hypothetical protein